MEIKQVKNFEKYYISKDGKLALKKLNETLYKVEDGVLWRRRSTTNKYIKSAINFVVVNGEIYRVLKQSENSAGYLFIKLTKNGVAVNGYIHRLVAEAFLEDTTNMDVHHLDHNKKNNDVSNLGIITHQENIIEQAIYKNGVYKDSHNTFNTHTCKECGEPIHYKSTYCKKHAHLLYGRKRNNVQYTKNKEHGNYTRNYKNGFIEKETLVELLTKENGNFTRVGKELGITDNAVRKWCKKYDLPYRTKEWKNLSN